MHVMFVCTISPVEYISVAKIFAKTFFRELIFADHGTSTKIKTAKILCCTAYDYSSRNRELHCNVQNVKSHVTVCLFVSTTRH